MSNYFCANDYIYCLDLHKTLRAQEGSVDVIILIIFTLGLLFLQLLHQSG